MNKINLSIPKPCHESWDQMTPVEKGKFCASCQKTVVDFTNMGDRQLAEFFKKQIGSACGRFHADQLNRDMEIPKRRIPWVKYFFQFSLPAFLVSIKANAQTKNVVKGDTIVCLRATMGKVSLAEPKKIENKQIHGKILSNKNEPVPYATVMKKGTNIGVAADSSGNFTLQTPGNENCILQVSAVGFSSKEIRITDPSLNIKLRPVQLDERVATVGLVVPTFYRKVKPVPLVKKIIDTAFKKFSVYPNPVQRHSNMKIDLKKLHQGQYIISIISMSGEVIQTKEVIIENGNLQIDFNLDETTAGTYFVRVFNRKTAASHSETIIVQ